jgi:hypothetical protein
MTSYSTRTTMENETAAPPVEGAVGLRRCAERIVARIDSWLEKNAAFVPVDVLRRRAYDRSWRHYIRALLGLFVSVRAPEARTLILFQGSRDRRYHKHFDPREVMIIGSRADREYARANGFAFAWATPLEGAIRLATGRGVHFFLLHQLRSWARLLRAYECAGIFLYEDTQAIGAFFANMAPLAGPHVKVVCIQHGYFPRPLNDLPIDGSVSQVNFVWDEKQVDVIGCSPQNAFVIGPPVWETAKPTALPDIVLVGTGTYYDGTGDYDRTLAWYKSLLDLLPQGLQQRVWYRPHPNELVNPEIAGRIRALFPRLDVLPLAERLAGEVAVFVGSLSSVLFEAGYAGHIVVRVGLREDAIPMFERHAEFSADQAEETAKWLAAACSGAGLVRGSPPPRPPLDFLAAARQVLPVPAKDRSR